MRDKPVDDINYEMGALEALFKGLPGIRDYVDKELRRSADKRLREQIVTQLTIQRQQLLSIQKELLNQGGLQHLSNIDALLQKLQTVTDRIRTASYGYAGFFSDIRIRNEEIDALYRFDRMLAEKVLQVEIAIQKLAAQKDQFENALKLLADAILTLEVNFMRRQEVILSPALALEEVAHESP